VTRLVALAAGVLAVAPTSSAKEVGAVRPPVALSVSPAHVEMAAPGSRVIRLRNVGTRDVVVDTTRKPLGPRPAAEPWVTIGPARLMLRPAASAAFTVRASPRTEAAPGDHHVLVLLTARPVIASRVFVRMRLGVIVRVRVAGRIVRRVELRSLRVRRQGVARVLLASVANRGNVSEELRGRVVIALSRRGRVLGRLRAAPRRELLPGTQTVFAARYAGRLRGSVTAVVTVSVRSRSHPFRRVYRIRL
jgi:hypothetical protein